MKALLKKYNLEKIEEIEIVEVQDGFDFSNVYESCETHCDFVMHSNWSLEPLDDEENVITSKEMMKIFGTELVNATPHKINIKLKEGNIVSIPPMKKPIRLKETKEEVYPYFFETSYSLDKKEIEENYPSFLGVCYIVSAMAAQAIQDADITGDFVSPGTLIRDDKGNVIGCEGFNQKQIKKSIFP